ncbi:MAG: N-acetylmuramoyl-L-alanine amidase [Nitrospirae bacterium]|nr:N-acetylmuramoyl-L-alanine amidase [Nitrospirota bacterium]
MAKINCLIIILLIALIDVSLADDSSIVVRSSEQSGMIRIVFETENESLISQASVFESYSLVKIDFNEPFNYKGGALLEPVKIYKKEDSLFMNIRNLQKIKFVRLSSPPRLVIDAYLAEQKSPPPVNTVQAETKELRHLVVMFDAGHGGADMGVRGEQFKESLLTLSITSDLAKQIAPKVQKAVLLRKEDVQQSIEQKLTDVGNTRIDAFFSIHLTRQKHFNIYISKMPAYASSKVAKYNTTLAQSAYIERSRALANSVGQAITNGTKLNVVYAEIPLPLLSAIKAPAVMLELPEPQTLSYNAETIDTLAASIIKALMDYAKR